MMLLLAEKAGDVKLAAGEEVLRVIASPWAFYLIAVLGAVAVFCLLPRGRPRGDARARRPDHVAFLAALGGLLGAAAVAGLIVFLVSHLLTLPLAEPLRTLVPVGRPLVGPFFYLFAVIALTTSVKVIVHPRPVYSVLYFVLTVLSVGGVLLLANARFLAIALVLIYAGAVVVTYVFVIMLAQHTRDENLEPSIPMARDRGRLARLAGAPNPRVSRLGTPDCDVRTRQPIAPLLIGFLLLAAIGGPMSNPDNWPASDATPMQELAGPPVGTVAATGVELFRGHLLAVELAGVLLLVAIVGAIAIARRPVGPADVIQAATDRQTARPGAPPQPGKEQAHA